MAFDTPSGETPTRVFHTIHDQITNPGGAEPEAPDEEEERTQVDAGPCLESTAPRPMSKSTPPPATWAPGDRKSVV